MPKAFNECRKMGGQIRTKTLPKGKYIHICYLNGNAHPGEVKKKKK